MRSPSVSSSIGTMLLLAGEVAMAARPDAWQIEVTRPSREVIFTNKEATHFACDTAARDQRSYGGLFTAMHKSLSDWVVTLDGEELDPSASPRASVWPWLLRREHARAHEEILLPDGLPVLLVRVETAGPQPRAWTLTPRVDMRWIWDTPRPAYETLELEGALCIRRRNWQPGPGALPWLAVLPSAAATWTDAPRHLTAGHPRDQARKAMGTTHPFEPGRFEGAWPASGPLDVAFALADSPQAAVDLARRGLRERDALVAAKRARIEGLLQTVSLATGDERLDRAYRWARASMDALIMNVRGKGIYAGFHWFPNYWSRDTFICVPGATLVTGQLDDARAILRSFLRFQLTDRASDRLGRLPNIVQPSELQYAGVDGTWWHVRAAYRYIQARREAGSPDEEFEREMLAALRWMIEGAQTKAVDEHGLLTHGDGETWMDAGGEQHPYSPRGTRAVEVQALYYNALCVARWLCEQHDLAERAARYGELAERTRASLRRLFWNEETQTLVDHLNADGSQDQQVRPNVFLALTAVEANWPPIVSDEEWASVVDVAASRLVLPYGVTSLDPADPAFHPRHLDLDRYYYDEAYHNGDVWYWLSGPAIAALVRVGRVEEARSMLEPLVAEILDHGAVGTCREIRDGGDSGETEEFGGATYQAWSLAEFLRALHEDLAPALGWKK